MVDEYINDDHFWLLKDTGVRIEGKAVWNFTAMFLQMWNFANHSTENYLAYKNHDQLEKTVRIRWLYSLMPIRQSTMRIRQKIFI